MAANTELRQAVIRFFTDGTVERPPAELLESMEHQRESLEAVLESFESQWESKLYPETSSGDSTADTDHSTPMQDTPYQTTGRLTLTQTTTLDSHFTATYASSPDYLSLLEAPSGAPIFCTQPAEGTPTYYAVENGILQELTLEPQSLTASVQLQTLPGVMDHEGKTALYEDLQLPTMEFTVYWQQYGVEILIDNSETDYRFDIGTTFGVDLGWDYDGRFYSSAIPGRSDLIQVFFNLDGQRTSYEYPFLLDLTTGEVSDPLSAIDFSAYACITSLRLSDDLTHATAMAGSDHDHLQDILIDLITGEITPASAQDLPTPTGPTATEPMEPPVSDCLVWFQVSEHTLFYATGNETSADGFLYDALTQTATPLFTDAAQGYNLWEEGTFDRYFSTIGGGYLLYYEGDTVSLVDLHDGSTTQLENVPVGHHVHYFFNPDFTVLSISIGDKDPDSSNTERICFLDMATMDAWYFDRELPEGVSEHGHTWFSPYGYLIMARNETTGTNHLYLYEYSPE